MTAGFEMSFIKMTNHGFCFMQRDCSHARRDEPAEEIPSDRLTALLVCIMDFNHFLHICQ